MLAQNQVLGTRRAEVCGCQTGTARATPVPGATGIDKIGKRDPVLRWHPYRYSASLQ